MPNQSLNMQLRNNIILKLLALLLFSLELVAPVFAQGSTASDRNARNISLQRAQVHKQATRPFFLFDSDNEETEEREAGQKDIVLYLPTDFFAAFHHITFAAPVVKQFVYQAGNISSQPPLYTLHCLFRI